MTRERDVAKDQFAAAQSENEQRQNNQAELLRLRGETSVLRRQLGEASKKNRMLPAVVAATNTSSLILQPHLQARFLTVPKDLSVGSYDSTSASILTREDFSLALQKLRSRKDVENLAEPSVVTSSGQEVRMQATQTISVSTNFCLQETNGGASVVPRTAPVEWGPVLDVVPKILSDGYTIKLGVIATMVEFIGYAPSEDTTPAYSQQSHLNFACDKQRIQWICWTVKRWFSD